MRNALLIIIGFYFVGCEPAEDYKAIRNEVVEEHDHVMLDSERSVSNREKIDSLLINLQSIKNLKPELDTFKEKESMIKLREKLHLAEHQMDNWMKEFDAELGTKSKSEAIAYFKSEKVKLRGIDSLFNAVLKESGEYLRKF